MEDLKLISIIHLLFTICTLQIAFGVNYIQDFGLISFGIALIIPCATSLIMFFNEFLKVKNVNPQ
jgi:hypothetical protein